MLCRTEQELQDSQGAERPCQFRSPSVLPRLGRRGTSGEALWPEQCGLARLLESGQEKLSLCPWVLDHKTTQLLHLQWATLGKSLWLSELPFQHL